MFFLYHREAPYCHSVLPTRVLPVGTQHCQRNRLPPADCAHPQQVPPDVLWESRAELRLSLQGEHIDSVQRRRNQSVSPRLTRTCFAAWVQAVIQVCDHTGSVCVVLWNSVCVSWYRRLNPGDVISLSRYRVKKRFEAESQDIGKVPILSPYWSKPEYWANKNKSKSD